MFNIDHDYDFFPPYTIFDLYLKTPVNLMLYKENVNILVALFISNIHLNTTFKEGQDNMDRSCLDKEVPLPLEWD